MSADSAHPSCAIRELAAEDPPLIAAAFTAQGWSKPREQFERYLGEQRDGRRTVLIAEVDRELAGYLTIWWRAAYPYRPDTQIPEIRDFNVLRAFQRRGVGTRLMDEAEARVARVSDEIGIGVGLHHGYGQAQILYVKRGYVPDGRGVEYRDRPALVGETVANDDELILRFVKRLRARR